MKKYGKIITIIKSAGLIQEYDILECINDNHYPLKG